MLLGPFIEFEKLTTLSPVTMSIAQNEIESVLFLNEMQ
jgi:hypothetical protein